MIQEVGTFVFTEPNFKSFMSCRLSRSLEEDQSSGVSLKEIVAQLISDYPEFENAEKSVTFSLIHELFPNTKYVSTRDKNDWLRRYRVCKGVKLIDRCGQSEESICFSDIDDFTHKPVMGPISEFLGYRYQSNLKTL